MEKISHKGKIFLFCLIVLHDFCVFRTFADTGLSSESVLVEDSNGVEQKYETVDALDVLKKHQIQLEKLEELVRNLSSLVSRLESDLSKYPETRSVDDVKQSCDGASRVGFHENLEKKKIHGDGVVEKIGSELSLESKVVVVDEEKAGAVSVTKYSPFWSDRFQFVSAVRLGSEATCINLLPFRDSEGLSKYVVVGDDRGMVYVLSRNGDVLVEFQTSLLSKVTAFTSYMSFQKNQTTVVTGHENGVILMHRIWEVINGDDWGSLYMETVGQLDSPQNEEGGSSITSLEVHHVGRNRYILSIDLEGKLRVFRENGTLYWLFEPRSRPLAFLKQRLLFLTETGAGSLDLRTMKMRESECEGLNNSIATDYVFDATERSKAYGFTSDGDLIHVLLLGDIMNFKCKVRSKKKMEITGPLSFQAIKGYLLIANQEKIWVYNVSSQHYVRASGPRLLFSAGLNGIVASFLNYQSVDPKDKKGMVIPLVASDQEKLVILGLGSGYVGMYRSNLPVFKNEFNTMLWTSPVLIFIIFLFIAWQFFAHKKEALTSWGTDDAFNTALVTSGAPLVSGQGDRSFADSSRNADLMDIRASGLRGPSGRYVSPSRYSGGTAGAYRSSSTDTNSRPSSVDSNFRTTSELKFRGSNLETSGFPKRRDNLFGNHEIVEDND